MKKKSEIRFVDKKVQKAFEELEGGKTDEKQLYKWLVRAFSDLEENCFCGIQIPSRLIPKKYKAKYQINNLWKYDLPKAWRLLYSIEGGDIIVISIILDWMNHKDYERLFGY